MRIADLKIGTRLGGGFGVVLTLMTFIMLVGVVLLGKLGDGTAKMIDGDIRKEALVTEWRYATNLNGVRTLVVAGSAADSDNSALESDIKATSARISELRKELDTSISEPDSKALYETATTRRVAYTDARTAVFAARKAGDAAVTGDLLETRLKPAHAAYLDSMVVLATHFKSRAAGTAANIAEEGRQGRHWMGGLWLLALLICVATTWWTTVSITRPLRRAVSIAETIAAGDLSGQIDAGARDETGQVLHALANMRASLMAIIGEVRASADVIATASGQIATGNLDLSARTEQQAASLEETASAMEQLTASVRNNAESAQQGYALAQASSDIAGQGGAVVGQVVQTMTAISQSSKQIADIIGVIDGIAFQTNILALNAAVEAARAGEQGRGFAVVASEVRNLAQRSAAAAKEIKTLIGNSVTQVNAGAQLVEQAGTTMDNIVESVKRVTVIMNQVMEASAQQGEGIEQINLTVIDMDGVTQQNAALVEEAAAAAQSLREEAGDLIRAVSLFTLETPVPTSAAAKRAAPAPRARRSGATANDLCLSYSH